MHHAACLKGEWRYPVRSGLLGMSFGGWSPYSLEALQVVVGQPKATGLKAPGTPRPTDWVRRASGPQRHLEQGSCREGPGHRKRPLGGSRQLA